MPGLVGHRVYGLDLPFPHTPHGRSVVDEGALRDDHARSVAECSPQCQQEPSQGEEDLLAFVANYRKQHVARRQHVRQSVIRDGQATMIANAKVEVKRARIESEKEIWQARQEELKFAGRSQFFRSIAASPLAP
jgi:hypothetical protein